MEEKEKRMKKKVHHDVMYSYVDVLYSTRSSYSFILLVCFEEMNAFFQE